jgi:hypothetical protein
MSDSTVIKIFDKSVVHKFIEKVDTLKKCLIGVGILSIVGSCVTLFNQYCMTRQIYNLKKKLEWQRQVNSHQMKNILENNIKLYKLLEKDGLLEKNGLLKNSDTNTNTSKDKDFSMESGEISYKKTKIDDEDCEYDNIPNNTNSSASISGLKSVIWFVKNL